MCDSPSDRSNVARTVAANFARHMTPELRAWLAKIKHQRQYHPNVRFGRAANDEEQR